MTQKCNREGRQSGEKSTASGIRPATPSNCGNALKPALPSRPPKGACGRGNDLGYGNNALDATMGYPQPSPVRWAWSND
jgi:hypothetical protein